MCVCVCVCVCVCEGQSGLLGPSCPESSGGFGLRSQQHH